MEITVKDNIRNKEMTILKALGIIFVVMGHKDNPSSWFPAYSFHMALFFFVSGYFYKEKYEKNILSYIIKRIKKIIPLYFLFNLFYMIVTAVLYRKYKILLGSLPNLKDFFLTPFARGDQFELFLAAWFILALLIIQIVFIILYKYIKKINKNIHVHLLIFFLIGLAGTCLAKYAVFNDKSFTLIVIRTCFGLCFYYFGFYYKQNENRNIFSSAGLIIALSIQVAVLKNFKNIPYLLVSGDFHGHIFLPFLTGALGIYVYLFFSMALSKFVKDNDILYKIGESTLSIMMNHIFVFFIINYAIIKVKQDSIKPLGNVFFSYRLESYWLVYDILGVFVPVCLALIFDKLINVIKKARKK